MANLVSNQAGEFTDGHGSSRGLSNQLDYQALVGYRSAANGILTTAKTARAEKYGRSKLAPLALASKSANFDGIPAVDEATAGPVDSLVYLIVPSAEFRKTKKKYQQPWIRVTKIGRGSAFRLTLALSRINWRKTLVESGAHFTSWLVAKHALRYLSLTITNASPAESPLKQCQAALKRLGVQGAVLEWAEFVDGTLFTRWTDLSPANHP